MIDVRGIFSRWCKCGHTFECCGSQSASTGQKLVESRTCYCHMFSEDWRLKIESKVGNNRCIENRPSRGSLKLTVSFMILNILILWVYIRDQWQRADEMLHCTMWPRRSVCQYAELRRTAKLTRWQDKIDHRAAACMWPVAQMKPRLTAV